MITLRAFHPDDADALIAMANNDRVTAFLRDHFPTPYTAEDANYWIEEGSSNSLGQHFAIAVGGDCAGSIGAYWGRGEFRFSAEVGYWLGEPYWGRGYASAALGQYLKWLFSHTEIERVYALVAAPNVGSMRVLEKNGFSLEGIQRRSVCKQGELLDEYLYACLR